LDSRFRENDNIVSIWKSPINKKEADKD
jgi:hypothetical protein